SSASPASARQAATVASRRPSKERCEAVRRTILAAGASIGGQGNATPPVVTWATAPRPQPAAARPPGAPARRCNLPEPHASRGGTGHADLGRVMTNVHLGAALGAAMLLAACSLNGVPEVPPKHGPLRPPSGSAPYV